jgi:hypothetical protein
MPMFRLSAGAPARLDVHDQFLIVLALGIRCHRNDADRDDRTDDNTRQRTHSWDQADCRAESEATAGNQHVLIELVERDEELLRRPTPGDCQKLDCPGLGMERPTVVQLDRLERRVLEQ